MNCPHCGQPVSETAKACGHCGQWLTQPPATPAETSAPPPAPPPPASGGGLSRRMLAIGGGVVLLLVVALVIGLAMFMTRPVTSGPQSAASLPQAEVMPTATPVPVPPTVTPTSTPAEPTPDKTATVIHEMAKLQEILGEMPIVFEDDFSTNDNGWKTEKDDGKLSKSIDDIVDGRYRIELESKDDVAHYVAIPFRTGLRDFWLSADITLVEATGGEVGNTNLGFAFRATPKSDYTVAVNDKKQYWLSRWEAGEWTELKPRTSSSVVDLAPGTTNNFGLLVQGSDFTLYFNDRKVDTITDDVLTDPGAFGLLVQLDQVGQRVIVEFDNVEIRSLEELPPTPIPTPAEPTPDKTATVWARATIQARGTATAQAEYRAMLEAMPIFFEDDFSTNDNGWTIGEGPGELADTIFDIVDGRYQLWMEAKKDYVVHRRMIPLPAELRNFWLSADITLIETSGGKPGDTNLGFVFRTMDGDFYMVEFNDKNQYWLFRWQDGEWTTVQSRTGSLAFNLEPGVTNNFGILAQDSEFTLYANGQKLRTVTDAALTGPGEIALAVQLDKADQSATVEFDNVEVRSFEEPATATPIPVLPTPTPKPPPTSAPTPIPPSPTPQPQVCNPGQWTACGGYLTHDGSRPIECPDSHVSECRNGQWAACVPDPGSCGDGGGGNGSSGDGSDNNDSPACSSDLGEDACAKAGGLYMHSMQGWVCFCKSN